MIIVDETGLDKDQALNRHRMVADAMRKMLDTEGWVLLSNKLKQEMNLALTAMRKAMTGDESLKACAAYTVLESILNMPEHSATMSLNRIRQIEQAAAEPVPTHHRSVQLGQQPKKKS